ncbi:hypothetical protein EMCRGX_G008433 [Ephydatia muelleri]
MKSENIKAALGKWLDALGLSLPIKENARVCSIHFCKEDFVGVEGYAPSKPKLKSDAVPSLLLFNDPTFSKNSYCNGHSTTCGPDSVRRIYREAGDLNDLWSRILAASSRPLLGHCETFLVAR